MIEVLSLSAVTAFLTALNDGLATEAAKAVTDGVTQVLRRVTGRPASLPSGDAQVQEAARVLLAAAEQSPEVRATLHTWMSTPLAVPAADRVPCELPPVTSTFFVDRRPVLKALDRELGRRFEGRPRLVNLYGPAGIGVTSAAAHWAARNKDAFPDGTLYLPLRGGRDASAAMRPVSVLQRVLAELGVEVGRLRADPDVLARHYRRETMGRRLLVVLDDVHAPGQVRDLVVAEDGVLTVLLSRNPLLGLCTPQPVSALPDRHARRLLRALAPAATPKPSRAAERHQLSRFQGSPWALTVMGSALHGTPDSAAARDRDADLHTGVLDALYDALTRPAARAYRLLALRPWPRITPALASAVLDLNDPGEAEALLKELADRQLLTPVATPAATAAPGQENAYTFRDHVQQHAHARSRGTDREATRTAAIRRALDELLRTAAAADYCAFPGRWHLGPWHAAARAAAEQGTPAHPSKQAALDALRAMAGNLQEAVRAAEELDEAETAAQLCETLWPLQLNAGLVADVAPLLAAAVRLADRQLPDTAVAARVHVQYALAQDKLGHPDDAERHLRTAAEYDQRCGHYRGQATALESLGLIRLADPLTHAEALVLFDEAGQAAARITEGMDGAEDLPRIRALLTRNRGRAMRSDPEEARRTLDEARNLFPRLSPPDHYNEGKTLIDIALTHIDEGDHDRAASALGEAIDLLESQAAPEHLELATNLRDACLSRLAGS